MEARSARTGTATVRTKKPDPTHDTQRELDGLRAIQNAIVGRLDRFEKNTKKRFDAMDKRFNAVDENFSAVVSALNAAAETTTAIAERVRDNQEKADKLFRQVIGGLNSHEKRLDALEATLAKIDGRTLAIKRAVLSRP